jgi:two-component system chemotaxis response regulator CheB
MQPIEVIAIGGSAGAFDALFPLLSQIPDDFVVPVIVVIHLPPSQPSLLPELLGRACTRRVLEVEDKMALQPHTIYVAPPNYHVLLERDKTLALSVDAPVHFSRPSIDVLFESVADALGGGIALIQDPATARHPEMPASAVRRLGGAAHIHPIDALARVLVSVAGILTTHQDVAR